VTDISDDGEQARAVVADGREEAGDVLVGADGVWSLVRKRILSDAPPRYSGLTMWRANLDVDEAEMPLVDFTAWWGRAAKLVYFRSGPTRISWEAIVASEADGRDAPGQSRAAVLERFAGFPELGLKIVEATDPRAIFRTDVYDRPPDARWGQGRVTLLGDAAHPMTFAVGQGAAQALEDGLALTDHLTGTGDVEQALRAYEAERIARAAHFQTLAWKLARAGAVRNPAGCLVRNTVFRIGNPIGFRMQFKETVLPDRTQGAAL
jgi:2-polyprenyl-6-methoxyphenol hydroxylase-like FAD-dependent oxidoreductase